MNFLDGKEAQKIVLGFNNHLHYHGLGIGVAPQVSTSSTSKKFVAISCVINVSLILGCHRPEYFIRLNTRLTDL